MGFINVQVLLLVEKKSFLQYWQYKLQLES